MSRRDGTRNWATVIEKVKASKSGKKSITMGTPGSAQVTRCRLLREYPGLDITTESNVLKIAVKSKAKKTAPKKSAAKKPKATKPKKKAAKAPPKKKASAGLGRAISEIQDASAKFAKNQA